MKEIVFQFLSNFKELSDDQKIELAELLTIEEIKKNKTIVNEGEICSDCFFILKGCLRQYVLQDGIEKTIGIYTENDAVNYFSTQSESVPTDSFLVSVEDTIVLVGNPKKDSAMYKQFPILSEITRKMIEANLGDVQQKLAKFITSSPEQRYLNLLNEKSDLLQRVPQHIIASYIGVTAESLSRIRKRMTQKKD